MDSKHLNPGEKTAAQADYEKKFNRTAVGDAKKLQDQEAAPTAEWKTITKEKQPDGKGPKKKTRMRFVGRHAGAFRNGSAFLFIIGLLGFGVVYTSVFAPNIIMVNLREMYTNDLADSTTALYDYYWKLMNYKIGRPQCGDRQSIKCRLTTMSQAQYNSFKQHGFTVLGTLVTPHEDPSGQTKPDPNDRYQVMGIIPPLSSPGFIAAGDMLYAYSKLSTANKALVYSVFNPKSGFYMDTRFKQRIKQKYDLTKAITVGGDTEDQVNKSFDNSLTGSNQGIAIDGNPNINGGISLGALRNPVVAAQYLLAANTIATPTTSYISLECSWYGFANAVTNDAQSAKAGTLARFAMQYLKAADQIKAGTSQAVTISTLSSKLAQDVSGNYNTGNATDSSMYKAITYGDLPIPSLYGLLYYENTYDIIGALAPAWSQLMVSAAGLGGVTGASGTLSMPPANLTHTDRDYCLSGETTQNKVELKGHSSDDTRCPEAVTAMAPPAMQGAVSDAIEVARRTCPPVNLEDDNIIQATLGTWRGPISNVIAPSQKIVQGTLTSYIGGLFSANVIIWANAMSLFFSSQTKGVAASDAIFAGTGELLGDMAQSRGMEPGNAATMAIYLAKQDSVNKEFEQVARYNAKKSPLDIYNKYSFLGSIVHSLSPTYSEQTPLFSTIANSLSLLGSGMKSLNPNADAIYYSQPDTFNPLRLSCADPNYLAIGIMADTACNVRYAMGPQELAVEPDSVLEYMTQAHPDLTQKNIEELQERQAKADPLEGDQANITRMLTAAQDAANKPQIDKQTGEAIQGSEYSKYLTYCVNRRDPWGRSGTVMQWSGLSKEEKQKRLRDKANGIEPISQYDSGDPYQLTPSGLVFPAVSEGASQDQDWYTGKKCLEQSEELMNFRAYTMLCSVDGSLSGGVDCTDNDNSYVGVTNDYYTTNNILFIDN